jgi:chromate transporter
MPPSLPEIIREWGRIGCLGFGGPPVHVAMLRDLCVERRGWIDAEEFEDAFAATGLLPGPASTQLAIWSAWRLRGAAGAVAGGLAFILPGLVAIVALAALFLGDPPQWLRGAGIGAGAAVPAVALHAAAGLAPSSYERAPDRRRWVVYGLAGALGAGLAGPWVVLVLLICGAGELTGRRALMSLHPGLLAAVVAAGGLGALAWTSFKVGALAFGGGFVIVPLMQGDAVDRYHWMTGAEFLNAVALGQVTPGPVTHTVAAVGFAAAGAGGALLAWAIAFAPSFLLVLAGGGRFAALRRNATARSFMDGAGPAAIGAIAGAAVPLALPLTEAWQWAVAVGALLALLLARRGVVPVLLVAGAVGAFAG